ncbi:MAG: DNA primase [Rhodospirillales bacterium]|nr:DNA primase [Rhodospirillales bacterium]
MAGIPEDFLAQLKGAVDLTILASQHLQGAKRQGKVVKGCCPFHAEKTPSFQVWHDHYHCYGCGEHGDAVQFVQKVKNYTFPEAVRDLADAHGLAVPANTPEEQAAAKKKGDLKSAIGKVNAHYQRALWKDEGLKAREYLANRGISEETIRKFGLGWGGSNRGQLVSAMGKQEVAETELLAAGVLTKRDDGGVSELYHNRITIPIAARNGDVISFGGRLIDDSPGPKYVNGPESSLFSKRQMLFGLNHLGSVKTPPIVVEGYLDVIAMSQAGINGGVAPLGTAMTIEQMELLWTMHPCPILCFDGDKAGRMAAGKATNTSLKAVGPGKSFRVAVLPEPEDPDSILRSQGTEAFLKLLTNADSFAATLYAAIKNKVVSEEAKGLQLTDDERPQELTVNTLSVSGKQKLRLALESAANEVKDAGTAIELHTALLRFSVEEQRRCLTVKAKPDVSLQGPTEDCAVRTMPKSLSNRTAVLLGMAMKWPEIALRNEEVLSIIPAPDRLKGLKDGIINWSRSFGHNGGGPLHKALGELGVSDIAGIVEKWASTSPALTDKSADRAEVLFHEILSQGKPQYKAWMSCGDTAQSSCGLKGAVQGLVVDRRATFPIMQIKEPIQSPSIG